MNSPAGTRRISLTYIHPTIARRLAEERQARLRAQANARRRIRRLGRRLANCA